MSKRFTELMSGMDAESHTKTRVSAEREDREANSRRKPLIMFRELGESTAS